MLKKVLSLVLSCAMLLSMTAVAGAESGGEKTLYYPSYLQKSEGETLTLSKMPERIVCLSNAALQILVRCDIHPIAVTTPSSSVDYPDWVKELPVISTGMSSLDIEAVLALEPDLVIVGSYQKETYGQQFADAGVHVYYTSEGPSIAYNEAKEEALTLARSFGAEALVQEITDEFAAVEARAADYSAAHARQSMMIFFHTPGAYQQTSQGYLGSMLAMLPFDNLSDTLVDPASRTVPIDTETAISMNPDVIFAISPTAPTAEVLQSVSEEACAENADLWNQLDAVHNGNVIYLSNEYVTSKGVQIVNSLNKLIDLLEERFPAEASSGAAAAGVTIPYPANMQEKGYTDPVALATRPAKVVCMSSTPVLALYEMGVNMIAIPTSTVVTWPEDLTANARQMQLAHNTNFDIETVVALEPDLVLLGYTSADTYGKVLTEAGVPVYFVDAGHTVSYDSIKSQTEALAEAFGRDDEAGAAVMRRFAGLEARLEGVREKLTGKTVIVLQSAPPSHYIQTSGGTLGSMAEMIGLTNVYSNGAHHMAQLDLETAIDYDPDIVLCVGMSPTGEGHRQLMEEDFAKNPDYWNSIPAIAQGRDLYLPVSYVSSAGINVIDNISTLADLVLAHIGE